VTEPAPSPEPTEPEPTPAEPGEPDGGDNGDQAGEQTLEQAAQQAGSEELLKKADQANRSYHKRLNTILGDDPNRHECPTCQGLGVTWGEPEPVLELVEAEDARPCEKCNAVGVVLTGSKNPQQATKQCSSCGGRGWQNVVLQSAPVVPIMPAQPAGASPVGGQWVPGRGFIPYGQAEPTIPDPQALS
jgi:hypothetical protein